MNAHGNERCATEPLDFQYARSFKLHGMETMTQLTIKEAAERTGLTVHTLRFYERIGLLQAIPRATSGHRRFREQDLGWIRLLICLRKTGMPLRSLQTFASLQREGDPTREKRRMLLEEHRRNVLTRQEEILAHLAVVEKKLKMFEQLRTTWDESTQEKSELATIPAAETPG